MMRTSVAHSQRTAPPARQRASEHSLAPVLIVAFIVLGLIACGRPPGSAPASDSSAPLGAGTAPAKPQGTQFSNPPTNENWTLANGLPSQVMRLAFSAADASRGYAAVFVTKQTQDLYTTTDSGLSWHQAGTVQGPVADFLSTDPLDPQDVVMLSVYAPMPGTYTFQRSLDGGRTWSAQTTDLPTFGTVSQTGWADSTFLVGFELGSQLQGSSSVVAFPKGQASVHLDAQGKLNGKAIAHLRLLTGHHNRIQVWGTDGSGAQNGIGVATSDLGQHWLSLPGTILGGHYLPTAASDDGSAIIAVSADNTRIAVSSDGGDSWGAQPTIPGGQQALQAVFITAQGKTLVVGRGDGGYVLQGGVWNRVTSKQVVNVSGRGPLSGARLWSSDAQGHVVWLDVKA